MDTRQMEPVTGVAAGVPYAALPPAKGADRAPLVVAWHMMDPPRTEAAMAASVPLADVPAWRVYLGLPLSGSRTPSGGPEELMRMASSDVLRNVFEPVVSQAAGEFPRALAALRERFALDEAPIGLVGGSAGGAVALLTLARGEVPVAAAALVNPVVAVRSMIRVGEREFGVAYGWSERSRAAAERLDFLARAGEIARRDPQPAVLLVGGEEDAPEFRDDLAALRAALGGHYTDPARVGYVGVAGMGHALAEEPGVEPAPQTPYAAEVDRAITVWFERHLP